ncbi:hypothetical protein ACFFWC_05755 [Plantactinospora siamensis]|uniref:Apea-like HEPN domain-containing protein n=1 Tax=Plantactinospora siamensis TaxID=555372 RepID=A0ABV6NWF9_9ACTN
MGTDAWRNWRAFQAGQAELENFDDELQSDVPFVGGPASFGPYTLSTVIRDSDTVGPAIALHAGIHTNLIPEVVVEGKLAESDSSAYHGGSMTDEIAALVSLELGVRLRLAGTTRLSGIHDERDSARAPILFEVPRLTRPGRPGREQIPAAVARRADVAALRRLSMFAEINEIAQVELVRAARSYAAALWWANEDPNQAWLQFVTAVETAATCRQRLTAEPIDLLREHWPELWNELQHGSERARTRIASVLAEQTKATRKFIDFLTECAPEPPDERMEYGQLDWSKMRRHISVIYGHRSKALHTGKPFPMPMLSEPRRDNSGTFQEIPWGLNSGGLGGVWKASETPMLLSTFEYITRGALLRWWDELTSAASAVAGPATLLD